MSDKYNLYRLSSTRELLEEPTQELASAVLIGGLDYDMDSKALVASSRASKHNGRTASRSGDLRGFSLGVDYLPQTLSEVKEISKLFPKGKAQVIVGTDGTEERFLDLEGKDIDVIHLSTHGFFWDQDEALDFDYLNLECSVCCN